VPEASQTGDAVRDAISQVANGKEVLDSVDRADGNVYFYGLRASIFAQK
jgi:hypothetical protein